ncbi:MAG: DoxX family protein [Cytophagales bacterium]|nr:MAG: DoxX family protein [Cytophagales bacterium]
MKIITQICRYLIGGLFIFSGAVKLNDPYGTANMLEEYFEVFATDFTSLFHLLVPYSIEFSVIICAFELLLGIAILFQYEMKKSMWIALLMTLFFTFLTFYSYYFDKVKECGCFGTVLPMTPKESFYKNIVTLLVLSVLFFQKNKLPSSLPKKIEHYIMALLAIGLLYSGYYITQHLQLIDNLNYKIGNNLPQLMQPEEKPSYKWILSKDGKEYEFTDANYPSDTNYKYLRHTLIGDSTKLVPKIVGLRIEGEDGDQTAEAMKGVKLWVVLPFPTKAQASCTGDCMNKINELIHYVEKSKIGSTMVLTSHASATIFEEYRHKEQLAAPYYFVDETILKTMIRANPGTILLKDGVVKGKWHYNDTPTPNQISQLL